VPSLDEIAADPQFVPEEITREAFEQIWSTRRSFERQPRPKYTADDLEILDDAVAIIRRNPFFYGGHPPRGPFLARAMSEDLIIFADLPMTVDAVAGWWLIASQKDWLRKDGADRSDYWRRIVPTPEAGRETMRTEVLLTAFANGLFTVAGQGIEWIVSGPPAPKAVMDRVAQILDSGFRGRLVAFTVD
jgi:hypothetical protein